MNNINKENITNSTYGDLFIKSKLINTPHAFSTKAANNLWMSNNKYFSVAKNNFVNFAKKANIPTSNVVFTNQVHKPIVNIINSGNFDKTNFLIQNDCDGLITNEANITLVIFTADCAPLLIYEPDAKIICALHCGWKPFALDIQGVAIKKIIKMGGSPKKIKAAIGPCIHKCCFEIGNNVDEAFKKLLGNDAKFCLNDKHANLPKGVAIRLVQLGVLEQNIDIINHCTSCMNDKYYSYRQGDVDNARLAHTICMQ